MIFVNEPPILRELNSILLTLEHIFLNGLRNHRLDEVKVYLLSKQLLSNLFFPHLSVEGC